MSWIKTDIRTPVTKCFSEVGIVQNVTVVTC